MLWHLGDPASRVARPPGQCRPHVPTMISGAWPPHPGPRSPPPPYLFSRMSACTARCRSPSAWRNAPVEDLKAPQRRAPNPDTLLTPVLASSVPRQPPDAPLVYKNPVKKGLLYTPTVKNVFFTNSDTTQGHSGFKVCSHSVYLSVGFPTLPPGACGQQTMILLFAREMTEF